MLWEEDPSTDELNPVQEEVVREYVQRAVRSLFQTTEEELEAITNERMEKLRKEGLLRKTLRSITGPVDPTWNLEDIAWNI